MQKYTLIRGSPSTQEGSGPPRTPYASLPINAEPIRVAIYTLRQSHLVPIDEHPSIASRPRVEIVIIRVDDVDRRIHEEEGLVTRRPTDCIRVLFDTECFRMREG